MLTATAVIVSKSCNECRMMLMIFFADLRLVLHVCEGVRKGTKPEGFMS